MTRAAWVVATIVPAGLPSGRSIEVFRRGRAVARLRATTDRPS